MHQKKRNRYASRRAEELAQENKELRAENAALEKELRSRDVLLEESEKNLMKLRDAYEAVLFEKGEYFERMTEARLAYENAAKEAREIKRGYESLILQLGLDVKQKIKREAV